MPNFDFPVWLWRQVAQRALNTFVRISQHSKCRVADLTKNAANGSGVMIMINVERFSKRTFTADSALSVLRLQQCFVAVVPCYLKKYLQSTIARFYFLTRFAVEGQSAWASFVGMKARCGLQYFTSPTHLFGGYFNSRPCRQLCANAFTTNPRVFIAARSAISLASIGMSTMNAKLRQRLGCLTSRTSFRYDYFGHAVHSLSVNGLARPAQSLQRLCGPLCILA